MNIKVELKTNIADGSEVVFRSPADCSQVTGLVIYHTGGKTEFAFADAHGNNVGDIDHLFAENAVVKVILDVTAGMAFVQNADTNAYIERTFIKSVNGEKPDSDGNVEIEVGGKGSGIYIGSGDMPEGFDVQIDPEGEVLDLASLMTEDEVEEAIDKALDDFKPPASGSGIEVSGAKVGDFLKVKEVDENGVPTAWETAEMPVGGGEEWELIVDYTVPEGVQVDTLEFTKDLNGNDFDLKKALFFVFVTASETLSDRAIYCMFSKDMVGSSWDSGIAIGNTMSAANTKGAFSTYLERVGDNYFCFGFKPQNYTSVWYNQNLNSSVGKMDESGYYKKFEAEKAEINCFKIRSLNTNIMGVGSTIKIMGVRK